MSISAAREAVYRGTEWLYDNAGEGWWDNVDLDTLDMRSTTRCVAGQAMGWTAMQVALQAMWDYEHEDEVPSEFDLGFDVQWSGKLAQGRATYEELEEAWRFAITQLQEMNA